MPFGRGRSRHGPIYACGDTEHSNPYEVLGIESCADNRSIAKAARKLKIASHPDKNPGNEFAGRTFIMAGDAEMFLRSPRHKKNCDAKLRRLRRCGKIGNAPYKGLEARIVDKFRARKAEIAKYGTKGGRGEHRTAFLGTILGLPLVYLGKASDLMFRSYAGVKKTYRASANWLACLPYDTWKETKPRKPSKSRTTKKAPVSGSYPTTAKSITLRAQPPITKGPTTTFTARETETVTATETETETETVTVTAYGKSIREHGHDASQLIKDTVKDIDPKHLGAGVIAVACAAGCWYCIRGLWHRRRRAPVPTTIGGGPNDDDDDNDHHSAHQGNDSDQSTGNTSNRGSRNPTPRRSHSAEGVTSVASFHAPLGSMNDDDDNVRASDEESRGVENATEHEQGLNDFMQYSDVEEDFATLMSDADVLTPQNQGVQVDHALMENLAAQEDEDEVDDNIATTTRSSRATSHTTTVNTVATLNSPIQAAQSDAETASTKTPAKTKSSRKTSTQSKAAGTNVRRSARTPKPRTSAPTEVVEESKTVKATKTPKTKKKKSETPKTVNKSKISKTAKK